MITEAPPVWGQPAWRAEQFAHWVDTIASSDQPTEVLKARHRYLHDKLPEWELRGQERWAREPDALDFEFARKYREWDQQLVEYEVLCLRLGERPPGRRALPSGTMDRVKLSDQQEYN